MPQEVALFPRLTVSANIVFGLARSARRSETRLREFLDPVDLNAAVAGRYPHQLSSGQQQRVALTRALAPELACVARRPFSSLDAGLREETSRAVAAAIRHTGATTVLVPHDQSEALSLADQVAVMREGHLVQRGTPTGGYRSPHDPGVASFVGDAVLVPAEIRDGRARCALGDLAVRNDIPDGAAQALVRPEQIRLHAVTHESGVNAVVEDISYYGHDASARLRLLPDGPLATVRLLGVDLPSPGTPARLTVNGDTFAFPVPR